MSTLRGTSVNARTVVLDAPQNQDEGPPFRVIAETGRLCSAPGCRNVIGEDWDESGRYCARCAIERDLWDRESRRLRCFPREPF